MKIARHLLVCAMLVVGAPAQAQSTPGIANSAVGIIRNPVVTFLGNDTNGTGCIAYNPNGRLLAVPAENNGILIFETTTGNPVGAQLFKSLNGPAAQTLGLCFSDTNILVSISLDHTAKTWDVESGKMLHSAKLDFGKSTRFVISPNRQPFAADTSLGKVRLWNYETGEMLNTLEPNDSWANTLAFTPDGKLLAIGTEKGVLRVMDVASWTVRRTVDLDSPLHSLAASADRVLLGYGDGTVAVINLGEQDSIPELRKQTAAINALAFSPNAAQFASASADHTIKVWDARTLKLLCSLEGHAAPVVGVCFSPNGQKIASIDANGNVNLWTVPLP